ncbi:DUF3164 family protein [Acetobacter fallax]|uniref:DUF3164 family protein n=1 Tax=Acetobacter fallax TaxID=1737473 RepID=A0ABX0KBE9_9PROT|nr:DUF3164 family protein [Acetobacter fallax]NHO33305.1 DUF3164 family protein [Acetobacter fallax]NHO36926.1 DUF3164 family protein [Acetobacter fallax]
MSGGESSVNEWGFEMIDGVEMVRNRFGRPQTVSRIRPQVVLTHQTALVIRRKLAALAEYNARVKQEIFSDIAAFEQLIFDQYNARIGGRRGGFSFESFDGCTKVTVATSDYMRTTEALPAAQALVNEILDDLISEGGVSADLRTLVTAAFERDERTGRVNVQRLIGLRQLNLQHPRWEDARAAISDAVTVGGSKTGIRVHVRPESTAPWEQIVPDFSKV